MTAVPHLTPAQREAIQAFDTCKIANAIERLGLRMRNEGFTLPGLQCRISGFPSVVGYAVTSRIRSADPPVHGYTCHDLEEWWAQFERYPAPRVAVVEDADEVPGQGAVLSNVHAEVLRALQCHGLVTNGAVRNIAHLDRMGFPAFSAHVAVSHSYVHMVEYSVPVEIFGLVIKPGDLIFVDQHGAINIPEEHFDEIVRLAAEIVSEEQRVIDVCRSGSFSISALLQAERNR
jgi:regulator of RNase E activity RraA